MYLAGLRVVATLAALCAGVTLCRGDSNADAQAAFEQKDYATALRLWEPLAEQGDTQAQLGLANLYLQGLGVPRDLDKAIAWLELTAEGGDPRGPILLGILYESGGYESRGGVPRDLVKAYQWLDIALSLSHTKVAVETSKLFLGNVTEQATSEQTASGKALANE
jgi:uncharacterized protein